MIKGVRYLSDRDRYYSQTNNSVERILERYGARTHLVACGPTAAVNCVDSMGGDVSVSSPGRWTPQPEDILTLWFHDDRNWNDLKRIRPETDPKTSEFSPHEVPQYYPAALKAVFGITANFQWLHDFDTVADHVEAGRAVQIALKDPGHYIAVVGYDTEHDKLIFHDPWPSRFTDFSGFARRMDRDEYADNVQPYAIIYQEVAQ